MSDEALGRVRQAVEDAIGETPSAGEYVLDKAVGEIAPVEYATPLDVPTLDEKASTQLGGGFWENDMRRDYD